LTGDTAANNTEMIQ